jgi:hypothetical protein
VPGLKAARAEIDELLKRHGIETYLIMWKDPDNDDAQWITQGSRYWRIGVLEDLKARELRDSLAPDED